MDIRQITGFGGVERTPERPARTERPKAAEGQPGARPQRHGPRFTVEPDLRLRGRVIARGRRVRPPGHSVVDGFDRLGGQCADHEDGRFGLEAVQSCMGGCERRAQLLQRLPGQLERRVRPCEPHVRDAGLERDERGVLVWRPRQATLFGD